MDKLREWLKKKYSTGEYSDKQLQQLYEAAGLTRTLLLRWVYDNHTLSEHEAELLMSKAMEMYKKKGD